MRDAENLKELVELKPDFIGFILYDKSPRYAGNQPDIDLILSIPREIRKVGVFVNATVDYILQNVRKYGLQYVQLHGNETPDFCKSLRTKGVNIIKAFRMDESFIFSQLNNYKPHVDFFLFDAKGDSYGGNGVTFDWSILKKYDNEKPYFLAGGISLDNLDELQSITPKPYVIDVNSKFEIEPGVKDIEKIAELITKLKERKTVQV